MHELSINSKPISNTKSLVSACIMIGGVWLVIPCNFQSATGQIYSPILIKGSVDERVINTGDNMLVSVSLTNNGQIPAKGLDVQVISPGFNIISQKKWPDTIYPNSLLIGQYVLQSTSQGTFRILISATYMLNNTTVLPHKVTQMVSNYDLGEVVVQSNPLLSWSAAWAGAPTTLLGITVGFLVTKATDYWTSKRIEERDKKQNTQSAKSYVLNWLEVNQKLVQYGNPPRFGNSWDGIEAHYQFIPEPLRSRIRDLNISLFAYLFSPNKANLSPPLCNEIGNILILANEWDT